MQMQETPVNFFENNGQDPFGKYYRCGEPGKAEKASAWKAAIGLQDVDGLQVSDYLVSLAYKHIDGEISIGEVKNLIESYYRDKPAHLPERTEEADIISARIEEILSEKAFVFSPEQYLSIHRRLFEGVLDHAGKLREYNITKKEWVLNGDTVIYGGAAELRATLDYDFRTEREFSYAGLGMTEIIRHLARFISRLWQIHVFGEGNTRTTAVFLIKYLRYLGFQANNDLFARHAWYFRNALVRANYSAIGKGIREDTVYLEKFLRNLLLDEQNELFNRELHIHWHETAHSDGKQHIKQPVPEQNSLPERLNTLPVSSRTGRNISAVYRAFGKGQVFSRSDIVTLLSITERPAAELLTKMKAFGLIEPVTGMGKGKYRFIL